MRAVLSCLLAVFVLGVAPGCSGDRGSAGDAPGGDAGTDTADAGTDAGEEPVDAGSIDPCEQGEATASTLPLPEEVRSAAPDLEVRASSKRLQVLVRRNTTLTDDEIEQYRARSCAAFAFDLKELGLSAEAAELREPVRVVVLDNAAYNAATGSPGTYGVTFGAWEDDGDAFVVPDDALEVPEDLDDTLAHELTHLFQGRWAPNDAYHPWYFVEGQAIDLGALFAKSIYGRSVSFVNSWVANAGPDDARITFDRYGIEDRTDNLSEVGHDQSISGLFVEYLRVVHEHGGERGYPDAPARVLTALQRTSDGATLAVGFNQAFGVTLSGAKQAFIDWLAATEGDPEARLAGTVWE